MTRKKVINQVQSIIQTMQTMKPGDCGSKVKTKQSSGI
jgi:hypothetical protein